MATARFVGIFVWMFLLLSLLTIVNGGRDPTCGPHNVVEYKHHKSGNRKLINLNNCEIATCADGGDHDCWCCMQWPGELSICYKTPALGGVHGRSFAQRQSLAYTSHEGQEYNCVNFYEQPAFSHPLLKSLVPKVKLNSTMPNQVKFNEGKEGCPKGTVPILSSSGEIPPPLPKPQVHCYAVVKTKLDGRRFLATTAHPTLHKPEVQGYQWSAARMKLSAGSESIETGWMVFPYYFKDNEAHLYVKYSAGASECFNTDCPGFVQVSRHSRLGSKPDHYSIFRGTQYTWNVTIEKSSEDGNWHLSITSQQLGKEKIGYWPGNLFNELKNSATQVEWGGEINNPGAVSPAPFMGSGLKAYETEKYAAYFHTISVFDVNYDDVISQETEEFSDCPELYVIRDAGDQGSEYGRIVYYGGKQSYD